MEGRLVHQEWRKCSVVAGTSVSGAPYPRKTWSGTNTRVRQLSSRTARSTFLADEDEDVDMNNRTSNISLVTPLVCWAVW